MVQPTEPSRATGEPDKAEPRPEPRPRSGESPPDEVGGADGPEPTRYGDWQHKGRVSDF